MSFETKVVYDEDGQVRCVRGNVDEVSDPDFIIIARNDGGQVRIARRLILKIEKQRLYPDRRRQF